MNIFIFDISAIQFWLSSNAHRSWTIEKRKLEGRSAQCDNRLAIDLRYIVRSELEFSSMRDFRTPVSNTHLENDYLVRTAQKYGFDPRLYTEPYLKELIDAGPTIIKLADLPSEHVPSISEIEASYVSKTYGITLPLHCAVRDSKCRRASSFMTSQVYSNVYPDQQFVQIEKGLWVASPELALLQAAKYLGGSTHFAELTTLCSEFLSLYVTDPSTKYGILNRQALTSPKRLEALLNDSSHKRSKLYLDLGRAANHASSHSASPFELIGALEVKVPLAKGGFGQGEIEQNYEIDTSRYFNDNLRHYRIVDLYLPSANLGLEFKGRDSHDESRLEYDTQREAELRASGIELITISRSQFKTYEEMERFMIGTLARKTNRRKMWALDKHAEARKDFYRQVIYAMSHKRWTI